MSGFLSGSSPAPSAADVTVDASGFASNLSATDDDVQAALATLDAMTAGGGGRTLIESITVAGEDASYVEFSAIPGTYRHLEIEYACHSDAAAGPSGSFDCVVNSDSTAAHYAWSSFYHSVAAGSGAASGNKSDSKWGSLGSCPGSTTNLDPLSSGQGIIRFRYYASTIWYKKASSLWDQQGVEGFDSEVLSAQWSGTWRSASAITTIRLTESGGAKFKVGSTFQLYGVA